MIVSRPHSGEHSPFGDDFWCRVRRAAAKRKGLPARGHVQPGSRQREIYQNRMALGSERGARGRGAGAGGRLVHQPGLLTKFDTNLLLGAFATQVLLTFDVIRCVIFFMTTTGPNTCWNVYVEPSRTSCVDAHVVGLEVSISDVLAVQVPQREGKLRRAHPVLHAAAKEE